MDGSFFVLAGKWHLQQTSKSKKSEAEKKSLGIGELRIWDTGHCTSCLFVLVIGVRMLGAMNHLLFFYCFSMTNFLKVESSVYCSPPCMIKAV